jgi:hypothetical protein
MKTMSTYQKDASGQMPGASAPSLTISPDTVFSILLLARSFDVKVPETDPNSGSNETDDGSVDALEFGESDQTEDELLSAIRDLNDDEQQDLIALIWLGRGDFEQLEWNEARLAATDIGRQRLPRYVMGIPLVSDYLEEGLSLFNQSLSDYMDRH